MFLGAFKGIYTSQASTSTAASSTAAPVSMLCPLFAARLTVNMSLENSGKTVFGLEIAQKCMKESRARMLGRNR